MHVLSAVCVHVYCLFRLVLARFVCDGAVWRNNCVLMVYLCIVWVVYALFLVYCLGVMHVSVWFMQ